MSEKIVEKFELYDVLGILIPGLVTVGMIYGIAFWIGRKIEIPAMPEALQVFILLAVATVLGQAVQTIGSLLEGFYFWTWRGRPSDQALKGRSKRISASQATDLKERLKNYFVKGGGYNLSDHEIFLCALSICNHKSLGRVTRFNSLYAYHRGLTTLLLLSAIATLVIIASVEPNPPAAWKVFAVEAGVTLLFWYRTKQRGMYFADEVLRMADLEIAASTMTGQAVES
ncbi:MAG: hypothetical protein M3362_00775 [Acidobacteriota bacterium]|nr:hypothetical protein [Acidobacteriota bacterium]